MDTHTITTAAPSERAREHAAAIAAGLRGLAEMLTEHPHLTNHMSTVGRILVPFCRGDADARAQIIAFARAGQACGAAVTEHNGDKWAGVDVRFGPVNLHVYADVAQVHDVTRIVEYTPRSILNEIEPAA